MTIKKAFMPNRDGDKKTWATNLKTKIATLGTTVGLTAAEITTMQNTCTDIDSAINTFGQAKTTYKTAASTKKSKVKADELILRGFIKRIKAHPAYSVNIGNDLGIIGEDIIIDEDNSKPVLVLTKVPSGYRIQFNLHRQFDGVNIYKKLAADTDYSFLARDTVSPYIDTTPVDNGTQYIAYYMHDDDEVGLQSDSVMISL